MFENIGNTITHLAMDQLGRNLADRIPSSSWHVRRNAVARQRRGCHGNERCLATAHWTFSSYGHLEAEHMNQFWCNLVYNSKFGLQWQSRDQILNFLKFKMADGRHVRKCWKCYNSPTNVPIFSETWVVTSHHVPDMSAMMRLPWQRLLPSNGALNIQQLWASGGRMREPILIKFGTQQKITTSMTVTWSNIKILKIQNDFYDIHGPIKY